jgi:hypothetical protein
MKEPHSNVINVCSSCVEEVKSATQKKLQDTDLTQLVGKFAKVRFSTGLEEPKSENMWVKVISVSPGERTFSGTLGNDPFYIPSMEFGNLVADRPIADIIEVLDDTNP